MKLCSLVSFIYVTIFIFYVKNMYKINKKNRNEESVLLFWDSVLFGIRSFMTESFANRP